MARAMYDLLTSKESMYYLEASQHKFRKLIEEGRLAPYTETVTRTGRRAMFFHPQELLKVKKELKKENYQYLYA